LDENESVRAFTCTYDAAKASLRLDLGK